MKEYLKKLGKTKFQAFLLVTIVNIVTLIAYLTGHLHIDAQIDGLMPVFNLIVQSLATFIYQHIEGGIDREAQKQQVYVIPGSAPVPTAFDNGPKVEDIPWNEVITKVKAVNSDLNEYMNHLDNPNLSEAGKEAIERYLRIYNFLRQENGPLPADPAPKGEDNP